MSEIEQAIERAKALPESQRDREAQRRSFAYGNANIENARVTREMVERAADRNKSNRA